MGATPGSAQLLSSVKLSVAERCENLMAFFLFTARLCALPNLREAQGGRVWLLIGNAIPDLREICRHVIDSSIWR
jgi:hypothetical protein